MSDKEPKKDILDHAIARLKDFRDLEEDDLKKLEDPKRTISQVGSDIRTFVLQREATKITHLEYRYEKGPLEGMVDAYKGPLKGTHIEVRTGGNLVFLSKYHGNDLERRIVLPFGNNWEDTSKVVAEVHEPKRLGKYSAVVDKDKTPFLKELQAMVNFLLL